MGESAGRGHRPGCSGAGWENRRFGRSAKRVGGGGALAPRAGAVGLIQYKKNVKTRARVTLWIWVSKLLIYIHYFVKWYLDRRVVGTSIDE
jgi:hypothetical protein